ncbi:class I SAM-dependent methyltransferase [Methanocella sp. CWC-04]|uniref:Class I SAM-dependent methyltransferase n=1 Tax=Methanooceanicella nereidis TaxID=2052831 RepID=A0AAP2RC29_9EURY|nr:class I SAM-dependent methyltransferase [Methanocella sp. CWC-04]MCD1294504.1 class I SAM-dependent methyltransferase [Methanocella sp. CWC-04]
MSTGGILSRFHPEGIPYPLSRVYLFISSSHVFIDFYRSVSAQVLKKVSSGRILDIGTGPGRLPIMIASRNNYVHVTGIDLSADMVKIASDAARDDGLGNVVFKVGNANSLPFDDREFDLVISTLSFHHWKQPDIALDEIYRVLRHGGEAWIYDMPRKIDPERFVNLKRKYGFFRSWLLRLHSFTEPFYNEKELSRLAGSSRFKEHTIDYMGIAYRLRLYKNGKNSLISHK